MKIVVFGPQRRVGALRGDYVVDLWGAFAKCAWEQQNDPTPMALAEALVPADLAPLSKAVHAHWTAPRAIAYLSAPHRTTPGGGRRSSTR